VPELVRCGISENYLKKTLCFQRQGKVSCWEHHKVGKQVMIHYSTLRDEYKTLIKEQLCGGNEPQEYNKISAINEELILKPEDSEFIDKYTYGYGYKLPANKREMYKNNCKYLWMLSRFTAVEMKQRFVVKSVEELLDQVVIMLKADKKQGIADLPINKRKLRQKVVDYKDQGAKCVIHGMYGNQCARKIKTKIAESVLMSLIAHPNKLDDTVVADKFNEWAKAESFKNQDQNSKSQVQKTSEVSKTSDVCMTITSATVGNYRRMNDLYISQSRDGRASYYNAFGKVIHRDRPSEAMLMINSDDNILDLFFRDGSNYYFRFALYVVIDAYNDYILGYAVGETVTTELVKAAYANAIAHVRELTGDYYIWHQLQTDSWNKKGLTSWYEAQGHYTPASTGNARAKIIERSFGTVWHQQLKLCTNYAGYNITAAEKRNPDSIERLKRTFPTKEEGIKQIAEFIDSMRRLPAISVTNEIKTKQQEWIESFKTKCKPVIVLADSKRLRLFGIEHQWTNELTNSGLVFKLNGKKYIYDIDKQNYIQNVGKKMQITYFPYDLNTILATAEEGKIEFVCKTTENMPMALADRSVGDQQRLNLRLKESKEIALEAGSKVPIWKETLAINGIDPEAILQAGTLVKELRHGAEQKSLENRSQYSEVINQKLENRDCFIPRNDDTISEDDEYSYLEKMYDKTIADKQNSSGENLSLIHI